jgi:hypothetical protein
MHVPSQEVHFLQIWAKPYQSGLKPKYYTRHYPDALKLDTVLPIVAPVEAQGVTDAREGTGPTPVHSPLHAFVSIVSPEKVLSHTLHPTLKGDGEKLFYAQLIQSSAFNEDQAKKDGSTALIKVSGGGSNVTLGEGDGVFVRGGKTGDDFKLENLGDKRGELILFEMDA